MLYIRQLATIQLKVDEEKYMEEVGQMWEDFEEGRTTVEPQFKSGYGQCWEAVTSISFDLSIEMNLDWESDSFGETITLYGGDAADYRRYNNELYARLQYLSQWVSL